MTATRCRIGGAWSSICLGTASESGYGRLSQSEEQIMKPSNFRQRRQVSVACLTIACLTCMVLPARSEEKPADLGAYCIAEFGAAARPGYDIRTNDPLCSEVTDQGYGLLHHRIDPLDMCRKQQGVDSARKEGRRIFCSAGDSAPDGDRKADLAKFCRDNYGSTAIVSRRLTDNQPLCTVRGNGGLSQTHYAIDLAELCRNGGTPGPDAITGDVLDCSKVAGSDKRRADQAPAERPGSKDIAPVEPMPPWETDSGSVRVVPATAIIPITDEPDLTGCGFYRGLDLEKLVAGVPDPPANWETGAGQTPCPKLSDGLRLDLDKVCRNQQQQMVATVLPDGRPICHPSGFRPSAELAKGYWMLVATACSRMYPGRNELRRGKVEQDGTVTAEGRLVPVVKYTGGTLECFYIDVLPGEPFIDWTDIME